VGPPRGHKPCQQTCSGMGTSLHGSAGPARNLLQHRAPHGVTASFRHPPALAWGPFHGLQVEISFIVDLHGLQEDSLPHHGLHHGLQGKNLCSGAWSTSSSSFFTDLGVCRVVSLASSHSSAVSPQVFPLVKYVITEALPPLLIGLALASGGSILEPVGIGSIRYGRSLSQLLTEATPTASLLPKPCHANPHHQPSALQHPALPAFVLSQIPHTFIHAREQR